MITHKTFFELTEEEIKEIRDDLYWTVENYIGKFQTRILLDEYFDDALRLYGDTKSLYNYFYDKMHRIAND